MKIKYNHDTEKQGNKDTPTKILKINLDGELFFISTLNILMIKYNFIIYKKKNLHFVHVSEGGYWSVLVSSLD